MPRTDYYSVRASALRAQAVAERRKAFFEGRSFDERPLLSKHYDFDPTTAGPALLDPTKISIDRPSGSKLPPQFALDWDKSCYFKDNKRQIDYVLAYDDDSELEDPEALNEAEKKKDKRRIFEKNCREQGLELEVRKATPGAGRIIYVLVHAPFWVLEKRAQVLAVKIPVRECDVKRETRDVTGHFDRFLRLFSFYTHDAKTQELAREPQFFTAPYAKEHRSTFVNSEHPDELFPAAERYRMVYDILTWVHYCEMKNCNPQECFEFGIDELVATSVYTAAYPIHQNIRDWEKLPEDVDKMNLREILYMKWAYWKNWYKEQPLDLVKRYFGTQIGLYFGWLGFYTAMLYPAALVGVLALIYGLFTTGTDVPTLEVCNSTLLVCPYCDLICSYQPLNSSCMYSKVTHLFDNTGTVFFAAFMSIWATLFLECWKRYHAQIAWRWGLTDSFIEEEPPRAEFQFRVQTRRMNPVTGKLEPYIPLGRRFVNFFGSGSVVIFFCLLVGAFIFGIIVYRVVVLYLVNQWMKDTREGFYFVIVTSAIINLVVILIMNIVYYYVALGLTRWECPRTQTDFDNSFTIKVFLFQFVNYYGSIIYVAFFKGVATQVPTTRSVDGQVSVLNYRLEGCDAGGCFAELVVLMFTIMVGRQLTGTLLEMAYPLLVTIWRRFQYLLPDTHSRTVRRQRKDLLKSEELPRWEKDYYLQPMYPQFLFDEYLEMVIQFGFLTLFVAAFPLTPLFALFNNILEIRLDAYKFLLQQQRPMPAHAKNIGIWFEILDVISRISVIGLIIAFSSDFVPKLVYRFAYPDKDMAGYINWSMAYFDTSEFNVTANSVLMNYQDVTWCRYRGFRNFPCSLNSTVPGGNRFCKDGNGYSFDFWKVLAARLAFVVIFEQVVFFVKLMVKYLIPDVPKRVYIQQQRERYLARKALLEGATASLSAEEYKANSLLAKEHRNVLISQRTNMNDVQIINRISPRTVRYAQQTTSQPPEIIETSFGTA